MTRHIIFDNADTSAAYENARENLSYRGIEKPDEPEVWDEVSRLEAEDMEIKEQMLSFADEGGWLVVFASPGLKEAQK